MTFVQVCGFDLVEDESVVNRKVLRKEDALPEDWTNLENPSFSYYLYYIYANLVSLNQLRWYFPRICVYLANYLQAITFLPQL